MKAFDELSVEELIADLEFLVGRIKYAWRTERSGVVGEWGLSSNSLVAIAYGCMDVEDQKLPVDKWDLAACEKMWELLPSHRKTQVVVDAFFRVLDHAVYGKDPKRGPYNKKRNNAS